MAILWSGVYPQIGTVAGTSTTFSLAATETGSGYWVITPATESWPTVDNIKAGVDSTFQPVPTGRFGVEALVSGVALNTSGYGLTSETNYRISLVSSGTVTNTETSGYRISFTTTDITAPAWSGIYPTLGTIYGTSGTFNLASNDTGSGYVLVVASGGAVPNSAGIKTSGTSVDLTAANTAYGVTVTGLISETAYTAYAVAQDEAFNLQSSGWAIGSFNTTDITAPAWIASWPSVTAVTNVPSRINLALKLNSAGSGFFVVVPSGSSAPSYTQIMAGTDANNDVVGSGLVGSSVLVANTIKNLTVTNLHHGAYYTIYVVAEDLSSNLTSPSVVSTNFRASLPHPGIVGKMSKIIKQRRKLDNAIRNSM